jgi:hypothetical protein
MEQHMDYTTVGAAQPETATRLDGRWLLVARVVWLGVTALSLGLVIPAFIVAFDRPELLGAAQVEALVARLAIPMQTVMAAALLVPMAAAATIAVFLFWRRSDDWMVLLFSLWMLTNSPSAPAPWLHYSRPIPPCRRLFVSSGSWRSSSPSSCSMSFPMGGSCRDGPGCWRRPQSR